MKMKKNMIRVSSWLLAVFAGMTVVQGADLKDQVRPVPTAAVQAFDNVDARSFPGVVRAFRRVELGFNVGGQLKVLNAAEGTRVQKGELIAQLDERDYQYRLDNAEAAFKRAKLEYDRSQKLFEDTVISKAEIDAVEAAFSGARAQYDIAKKAFEDTSLYAPFDAVIAQRHFENFEHVAPKKTVISLHDINEIEVVINIPERLIATTQEEDIVSIGVRFDADPSRSFPATANEYRLSPNRSTRTYECTVKLNSPADLNIFTGMTANVEIVLKSGESSEQFLKVPSSAVFTKADSKSFVWIVPTNGGRVELREVRVGKMINGDLEIVSGLSEAELVATAGVHVLEEGQAVRPSKANSEGLEQ